MESLDIAQRFKSLPPLPHVDMESPKLLERFISIEPTAADEFCLLCKEDILEFLVTSILLHVIHDKFSAQLLILLVWWAILVAGYPLLAKRFYNLHRAITVFAWWKNLDADPDFSSWEWVCSWFTRFILFLLLVSEFFAIGEEEV